jgi:serine/threonine-protein kinase RsbT
MTQSVSYQNSTAINQSFTAAVRQDVVKVRSFVRQAANTIGFGKADQIRIATAVSEICRNVIDYAKKGQVIVKSVSFPSKRGLLIKVTDQGPGILNISQAMQDGFSSCKRPGIGLPGSKRMMDLFGIESGPEAGTKITMCKWLSAGSMTSR